ncbi:MAG: HEPN domain-containing protein [Bacteroidales bacterium]|nr:HEPN domain-containing protein [Bacteroidales bacterium]
MSLTEEERKIVVSYRLEKSFKMIEQVKNILPMKYWDTIANRLYYAAYYAVTALLIQNEIQVQTHQGVKRMFGYHFIMQGKIDSKYASLYSRLFSMRQTGDYDDNFDLSEEDVIQYITPTEELIKLISTMVNKV